MVAKGKISKIEKNTNRPAKPKVGELHVARKNGLLEQNTEKIKKLHNSIVGMLVRGLKDAIQIGQLLFEQKEIVPKTGWKNNLLQTQKRHCVVFANICQLIHMVGPSLCFMVQSAKRVYDVNALMNW